MRSSRISSLRPWIVPLAAPVAVLAVHLAVVLVGDPPPETDVFMHFFGGFAIAFAADRTIRLAGRPLAHPSGTVRRLLAIGAAAVAAIGWEAAEALVEPWVPFGLQPSIADTIQDLLLGLGGAVAFALSAAMLSRRDDGPRPGGRGRVPDPKDGAGGAGRR